MDGKIKRILIIKPSSFGDIIHALPSAAALKRAYPNSRIYWIVFKVWADIARLCPDIDEIIVWDRNKIVRSFFEIVKKYKKTEFDYIIDLQGLLRSAILAKTLNGKVKIGVSGMKEFSSLLIKEVYPENAKINAVMRNLKTIEFITKTSAEPKINLNLQKADLDGAEEILKSFAVKKDFIALLPFARGIGKDWGESNYLQLLPLLKEKYPKTDIVILGMQKDFGKIKSTLAIDLCGKTALKQLPAILAKSKYSVGADTGAMHLAAVLNIPSVFIWGNSDIVETSPYLGRVAILENKLNKKDIAAISPQAVIEALEKLQSLNACI